MAGRLQFRRFSTGQQHTGWSSRLRRKSGGSSSGERDLKSLQKIPGILSLPARSLPTTPFPSSLILKEGDRRIRSSSTSACISQIPKLVRFCFKQIGRHFVRYSSWHSTRVNSCRKIPPQWKGLPDDLRQPWSPRWLIRNERLRMQARQGAASNKMSGCECKPDAKRKRDSVQPQETAQPVIR